MNKLKLIGKNLTIAKNQPLTSEFRPFVRGQVLRSKIDNNFIILVLRFEPDLRRVTGLILMSREIKQNKDFCRIYQHQAFVSRRHSQYPFDWQIMSGELNFTI